MDGDVFIGAYKAIEVLFSLPFEQILSQQLVLSPDLTIVETTETVLAQTAHFVNLQTLQHGERPLDNLDMILYDAFLNSKPSVRPSKTQGSISPKPNSKPTIANSKTWSWTASEWGYIWGR